MFDFLGRFDHPQPHGRRCNIHQLDAGKGFFQIAAEIEINVVKFDTEAFDAFGQPLDGRKIIGLFPVRIGDIVTKGTARWLAAIDRRRHRCCLLMIDHEAVAPTEIAIQEIREIADVMVAREKGRIHLVFGHEGANTVLAALHLACGEGRLRARAIIPVIDNFRAVEHTILHLKLGFLAKCQAIQCEAFRAL